MKVVILCGGLGTRLREERKALETQVTVDYKQKTVHDILEDLKKKVPGLSIHWPGASQPRSKRENSG